MSGGALVVPRPAQAVPRYVQAAAGVSAASAAATALLLRAPAANAVAAPTLETHSLGDVDARSEEHCMASVEFATAVNSHAASTATSTAASGTLSPPQELPDTITVDGAPAPAGAGAGAGSVAPALAPAPVGAGAGSAASTGAGTAAAATSAPSATASLTRGKLAALLLAEIPAWQKQGLTLVHFSAQPERFSWDRGYA